MPKLSLLCELWLDGLLEGLLDGLLDEPPGPPPLLLDWPLLDRLPLPLPGGISAVARIGM